MCDQSEKEKAVGFRRLKIEKKKKGNRLSNTIGVPPKSIPRVNTLRAGFFEQSGFSLTDPQTDWYSFS